MSKKEKILIAAVIAVFYAASAFMLMATINRLGEYIGFEDMQYVGIALLFGFTMARLVVVESEKIE